MKAGRLDQGRAIAGQGRRAATGSVGALETYALGCQRINVRSSNQFVAIAAQVVGTQRVDGDDDNVNGRRRFGRGHSGTCKQKAGYTQEN